MKRTVFASAAKQSRGRTWGFWIASPSARNDGACGAPTWNGVTKLSCWAFAVMASSSVIAELMTREHGRHLGMVRSGRSRAMQPVLQPGNSVDATWRARIEEHLGLYALEAMRLRTSDLMASSQALHGVGLVCALLRLLPEREPHVALYEMARLIVDRLHEAGIAPSADGAA